MLIDNEIPLANDIDTCRPITIYNGPFSAVYLTSKAFGIDIDIGSCETQASHNE